MNFSFRSFLPAHDFGWNHVRAKCSLSGCHNKLLSRAVPHSRSGVLVGDRWYCSPDCFAAGSRPILTALSMSGVLEMPRNPRLSIGLAMLSRGYLTEAQLRLATDRSRESGQDVEATLMELGLATEKQIAAGRAAQWGYPVLAQEPVGHMVQTDLPRAVLQSCSAAPLHASVSPKRLVLGFVARVDHNLLQSVEQMTGCRPEPCFITPGECEEQIGRVSAVPGYEEYVVENPASVTQMARTLGGLAVEVGAREARFTRCRSWAWARLSGKRGTADLIFAMKDQMKDFAASVQTPSSAVFREPAVVLG